MPSLPRRRSARPWRRPCRSGCCCGSCPGTGIHPEYHRNVAHQRFGFDLVHPYAVEQHVSPLRVVEPCAEFHQRAFSASRRAYERRQRTLRQRERYVVQHLLVAVGERYPFQRDVAVFWGFAVARHFRFLHQAEYAPSRDGKIAELREIRQCRSQRVEDARADDQKHHEHQQR